MNRTDEPARNLSTADLETILRVTRSLQRARMTEALIDGERARRSPETEHLV